MCMCVCMRSRFSHVWFLATPWTLAHQTPLSMEFPRQEYWSGLSCPPPGHLLHPEIEPTSLTSPAWAGGFFTTSATQEAYPMHLCPSSFLPSFPFSLPRLHYTSTRTRIKDEQEISPDRNVWTNTRMLYIPSQNYSSPVGSRIYYIYWAASRLCGPNWVSPISSHFKTSWIWDFSGTFGCLMLTWPSSPFYVDKHRLYSLCLWPVFSSFAFIFSFIYSLILYGSINILK